MATKELTKENVAAEVKKRKLTSHLIKFSALKKNNPELAAMQFLCSDKQLDNNVKAHILEIMSDVERALEFTGGDKTDSRSKAGMNLSIKQIQSMIEYGKTTHGKEVIGHHKQDGLEQLMIELRFMHLLVESQLSKKKILAEECQKICEKLKAKISEQRKKLEDLKEKTASEAYILIKSADQEKEDPIPKSMKKNMEFIYQMLEPFGWGKGNNYKEVEKKILNQSVSPKGTKVLSDRPLNALYRNNLINMFAYHTAILHLYVDEYLAFIVTQEKELINIELKNITKYLGEKKLNKQEFFAINIYQQAVNIDRSIKFAEEKILEKVLNQLHRLETNLIPEIEKYISPTGFCPALYVLDGSDPIELANVSGSSSKILIKTLAGEDKTGIFLLGSDRNSSNILFHQNYAKQIAQLKYAAPGTRLRFQSNGGNKYCSLIALAGNNGIAILSKKRVTILIDSKMSKEAIQSNLKIGAHPEDVENNHASHEINTYIQSIKSGCKVNYKKGEFKLEDDSIIIITDTKMERCVKLKYKRRQLPEHDQVTN